MKHLTILLLILKVGVTDGIGQIDITKKLATDTVHDTIFVSTKADVQTFKEYQDILEKTNQQLSLWWNPFSVLITTLGILFTILTIIAAIIVYRQGKEHREILGESIRKNEAILSKLIFEKNQQLKAADANLSALIEETKEKFNTETDKNKNELNEFLARLESQKKLIESQINPLFVKPENHPAFKSIVDIMNMRNKAHICSLCQFEYFIIKGKADKYSTKGINTLTCPKCGHMEHYYDIL